MDPNRSSRASHRLRESWQPQPQGPAAHQPPGRATFHLPADLLNEMRNTVVALAGPPQRLTMSKLAANALRRELDRLRHEQRGPNRGRAFVQRSDEVTRGRPVA